MSMHAFSRALLLTVAAALYGCAASEEPSEELTAAKHDAGAHDGGHRHPHPHRDGGPNQLHPKDTEE